MFCLRNSDGLKNKGLWIQSFMNSKRVGVLLRVIINKLKMEDLP